MRWPSRRAAASEARGGSREDLLFSGAPAEADQTGYLFIAKLKRAGTTGTSEKIQVNLDNFGETLAVGIRRESGG
jgi:hypothetical protein